MSDMTWFLALLLIVAMIATGYALVRGVISMANGKDFNGEQQQSWMRKRVLYQGIAIVIMSLIFVTMGAAG